MNLSRGTSANLATTTRLSTGHNGFTTPVYAQISDLSTGTSPYLTVLGGGELKNTQKWAFVLPYAHYLLIIALVLSCGTSPHLGSKNIKFASNLSCNWGITHVTHTAATCYAHDAISPKYPLLSVMVCGGFGSPNSFLYTSVQPPKPNMTDLRSIYDNFFLLWRIALHRVAKYDRICT